MSESSALCTEQPVLEIVDLAHGYEQQAILHCLSLSVMPGEFVALLGSSGCGKTTLLRAVAGLIHPQSGSITIGLNNVYSSNQRLWVEPQKRGMGMVFQDYALWPHMTVRENVGFPLEALHLSKDVYQARVTRALQRVHLAHLASRFPGDLSGGQQQRVGLARAIVAEPQLVLFDEPLSNLDSSLRLKLSRDIRLLVKEMGASALYVTHDRHEALSMADRVAVMHEGKILQIDTPQSLYESPMHIEVARFLQMGALLNDQILIPHHAISTFAPTPQQSAEPWQSTEVLITGCWFAGHHYEIEAKLSPYTEPLTWTSPCPLPEGSVQSIFINPHALREFDSQSGLLVSTLPEFL